MGLAPSQGPKNHGQTFTEAPIMRVITRSDPNKSKADVLQRHSADNETKIHGFALFARDLQICWGKDQRYWKWTVPKGAEDSEFEIAELIDVCWLDIVGKFDECNLTPKVTHEVVFAVMMREDSQGWEVPVTLKIKFPDGRTEERKESLEDKPKGQWIELKVSEILTPQKPNGEYVITLFQNSSNWKRGLIVKGLLVRPKR